MSLSNKTRFIALVLGATVLLPRGATGQESERFKVLVEITEEQILFSSPLSSALRRLGDVEVVYDADEADFAISLTALCDGDCDAADRYAVSWSVGQYPTSTDLGRFSRVGTRVTQVGQLDDEDLRVLATALQYQLREAGYTRTVNAYALLIGANRVRPVLEELVAEFDTLCLDWIRIVRSFVRTRQERELIDGVETGLEAFTASVESLLSEREWWGCIL